MKEIIVEGYRVIIERQKEGTLLVSVPALDGCSVQVDKEAAVETAIKRAIGDYLRELASKRPLSAPMPRPPKRGGESAGDKSRIKR